MEVETYEVNETLSDGTVEQTSDPEALALIEQMGLRGQETLLGKREAGDDVAVVRCPYRRMSAEEQNVFAVVCPQVTSLEDYASGPIPLRVLQVAAHAHGMFRELQVWHPTDARVDDPVLVGIMVAPNKHGWNDRHRYILARWGETLPSMEELREMARGILHADLRDQVESARANIEAFAGRLDSIIDKHLRGGRVETPDGVRLRTAGGELL
ncbi:MAG TPA: hypothetical protein VFU06_00060 [Longimicrobiales bacterium]|nr:hypothetical protein [Longimicrobiales bacterium]